MAQFDPIQLVHHKTGEECTAWSALGLNNLVAAGYARKNEVRQPQLAESEKADAAADSTPSEAQNDAPTKVSTEGETKPTSARTKRR